MSFAAATISQNPNETEESLRRDKQESPNKNHASMTEIERAKSIGFPHQPMSKMSTNYETSYGGDPGTPPKFSETNRLPGEAVGSAGKSSGSGSA